VEMLPQKSGSGRWQVAFESLSDPCLAVSTAALDIRQGTSGQFKIQNFGPKGDRYRVRVSDARVKVTPAEGELGPWPAKQTVNVSAVSVKLEPGDAAELKVVVEAASNPLAREGIVVRVHAPPPENLALRAKAAASSIWSEGYEASKANDGNDATRWNSRQGDLNGSWLELTWPQPVEFNRVEIDECTDFGPRIQAWHLEAGGEQMTPIARGDGAGRQHLVKLPRTVKATRLRLVIDKASVVPTIWELKAFRGPEGK
jgi:F5/8 type C domain